MTVALIAVPFLAALLVGFLPLSRVATEGLAFAAAFLVAAARLRRYREPI